MSATREAGSGDKSGGALLVEDEPRIRELVSLHLRLQGLHVTAACDGEEALRLLAREAFDIVILDLMLPKIDGVTVCRAIRRQAHNSDVPVLMLTARRDESDKVLGLESGADDYLTKPFGVRELVARVRALLRRPRRQKAGGLVAPAALTTGAVRIDSARRQALVHGRLVDLTPHEFDVLFLLAANAGIVFSRTALLEHVWTHDVHVTVRSVDSLVKRLRQKIEDQPGDPKLLLTVRGCGYKFTDE